MLISTVAFLFVRDPEVVEYEVVDPNGQKITMRAHDDSQGEYTWDRTINMMAREKFQAFIPMFLTMACLCTIYTTYLAALTNNSVSNIWSWTVQNERLGFVMLTLGVAEVVAGQIFGYLLDYNKKAAVIAQYSVIFSSLVVLSVAYATNKYWLYILVATAFGLSDTGSQTIIGALLAGSFTEKYEQFAAYRSLVSLMIAMFFLVVLIVGTEIALLIYFAVIVFGAIMLKNLFSYI